MIHDRITLGGENELLNKRLTMNLNAVQLVVVISDQPGNTHKQHNKIRYERCKRYERIICENEIRVSKEKRVKHKKTAQNHTLIVTCNHWEFCPVQVDFKKETISRQGIIQHALMFQYVDINLLQTKVKEFGAVEEPAGRPPSSADTKAWNRS